MAHSGAAPGPGQVSRLPPELVEAMTGILNGVHDRSREEPTFSCESDDLLRSSLTDDLQEMSEGPTASIGGLRLLIPGQQSARVSNLSPSDGRRPASHPHYLGGLGTEGTPSTTERTSSPLERFWDEPQRHERIAFMMQEMDRPRRPAPKEAPAQRIPGHAPRIKPATPPGPKEPARGDGRGEGGRATSPGKKSKSPSPGFCPGLEIDAHLDVDEDMDMDMMAVPDLEAIRIAARIRYTEEVNESVVWGGYGGR